MFDIDNLTEEELRTVMKEVNERITAIEKKKEEEKQRKENYCLVEPPKRYKIDTCGFYNHILETNFGEAINKKIKDIADEYKKELSHGKEEIFPCPVCGKMTLRVMDFSELYDSKYSVGCDDCDFCMEDYAKYSKSHYGAWYTFAEWLVKNGYLSKMPKL